MRSARVVAQSGPAWSPRSPSKAATVSRAQHGRPACRFNRAATSVLPSLAFVRIVQMREYVALECTECGSRNYRTQIETRSQKKLELKKYCKRDRKRTVHKERKK